MRMLKLQHKAIRFFSSRFRVRKTGLQKRLLAAGIYMPAERWQSLSLFYATVCTIVCAILAIFSLFGVEYLFVAPIFEAAFALSDLLLIALVSGITFSIAYSSLHLYPAIKAWERGRKINALLPPAIGYISSMAKMGLAPYDIFKTLSVEKESYKEVSVEAMVIVRNVEMLGMDMTSAIMDLATTTPSSNLRVFLQGATASVTTGGDMGTYFINKSKQYMEENRRKYEEYISMLGIISEVYVVAMVATPIFVIVLFTAMSMMGGADLIILYLLVYMFIPFGSLIFILMIDSISPEKG